MSDEIIKQDISPLRFIEQAIDKGLGIEHLEKLMDLKERWDKSEAKREFDEDMMGFQMECPIIKKTKEGGKTKGGVVAYKYAPLEDIIQQVKETLSKHGFSFLIKTEFPENKIRVTCSARHVRGHSEDSVMEVPYLTQTGVMSDAQVVAATVTFAKRYAFCNAFGIMTADDDTDAITDSLKGTFENIVKDWQYKEERIYLLAEQIQTKTAFLQFLETLPTTDHTDRFIEILTKIDKKFHHKLWLDYSTQNKNTVDDWLTKLSTSKLIINGVK